MISMWRKPFWQGYVIGVIICVLIGFSLQWAIEYQCEQKYSLNDCRTITTPVAPDGTPLDITDPFHEETK